MHNNTRQTLIAKLKNTHDQRSWEEFTHFYERYIFMVIYNMGVPQSDVDDLSQKVLLILWKKLPEFNYEPGVCKFRTWMNLIIRNTVLPYFRNKKKYNECLVNISSYQESDDQLPDIYKIAEENWKNHLSNLAWENIEPLLTENNRKCFLMFTEGKSAEEIAELTEIKLNTVYVIRKRVIEKLSEEIRRLEEELS